MKKIQLQVPHHKSSAISPKQTSPYLRTPTKTTDTVTRESNASKFSNRSKASIHSVTEKDIDKEAIHMTNELQYASLKVKQETTTEERQKNQFNEKPLLPNQTSLNTILVKAPRSRSSLIDTTTSWDKGFWTQFCRIITCCIPTPLIARWFKQNPKEPKLDVIQAWREKVSLCILFLFLMSILAFITFLISTAICAENFNQQVLKTDKDIPIIEANQFGALGSIYDYQMAYTKLSPSLPLATANRNDLKGRFMADIDATPYCDLIDVKVQQLCTACYKQSDLKTPIVGQIRYSWEVVMASKHLFVYNSYVVDLNLGSNALTLYFPHIKQKLQLAIGKDITYAYREDSTTVNSIRCFAEAYKIGYIDTSTVGCTIRDIISTIAMIAILSLIIVRFSLAIGFSWFLSWKLGKWEIQRKKLYDDKGQLIGSQSSLESIKKSLQEGSSINSIAIPPEYRLIHSILMVTCYSEDESGLKTTLDSLSDIQYPNRYKLIIVVCDGLVKGGGQTKTTPEIVLGLIKEDLTFGQPEPKSYFSIADGKKRHNMAKIHCGQYISVLGRSTNIVVIIKCGTLEEQTQKKPGNRGKRDSQIVLMDFYRAVMFDAPMSPLQFELFNKIYKLTRNTADKYEIVLMVDADTKVMPDALSHMTAVMANDPKIMGLCGETRIMNKSESWVSAIQVFEYHVAHHLAKAFESCFGGVTCLPGCFCMYRIKAPRKDGSWTPILASPEVVKQYSENVVNTLHKKNLLLLGEDRFLSTLMLRTYPNRKMMFVPKAVCKTCVPNSFKVLLSQRRRWINSTIHNLFELLLVQELCGTFCFSMQFVVLLELIGTLTLPAAIVFTTVVIIKSIIGPVATQPLLLLAAILGLPGLLIFFTTQRLIYVKYMIIYLFALPIWNFVLPAYAYFIIYIDFGILMIFHGEKRERLREKRRERIIRIKTVNLIWILYPC